MERIQYITALREYEGMSIRAIAEKTGHHFNTVKKYVDQEDWNTEIKPRKEKGSKLDPLKAVIDKWLEEDLKMTGGKSAILLNWHQPNSRFGGRMEKYIQTANFITCQSNHCCGAYTS